MKIEKQRLNCFQRFDGTALILIECLPNPELDELLEADVDIEIKKHREKRSLSANAYAWVLIDKLSEALRVPQTQVYREAVRNIGGVSQYVCIKAEAVETMRKLWEGKGIGWQVEELDSKIEGCVNLRLIGGSSVYNTAQMSALIDVLRQDCEAVGIETKTPEEIRGLLELWEKQQNVRN